MRNNQELIDDFILYKENKSCSKSTLDIYKSYLNVFSRSVDKHFKSVTEKDVLLFLSKYNTPKAKNGRMVIIKQFYRFIYGLSKKEELPDCVKRIEFCIDKHNEVKYRERVITKQEYNAMILCCKTPMQRAMLETMYNFGVRKSELLSIRLKDVTFNGENTRITVRESKTETRDSIFPGRSKHLLEWVETLFPFKDDQNHYVFFSSVDHTKSYVPEMINEIVKSVSKDAGIKRRIKPHDFRHTKITYDRKNGVPEAHIETNVGLVHGSKQIKTYDHNRLKDYEEWLRKRGEEIQPLYDDLKNKHEEKINQLEAMFEVAGFKTVNGVLHEYVDEDVGFIPKIIIADGNTKFVLKDGRLTKANSVKDLIDERFVSLIQ